MVDEEVPESQYVVNCGSGNQGKKYAVHMYNALNSGKRGEWEFTKDKNKIYVTGPESKNALDKILQPESIDKYKGKQIPYDIEKVSEPEETVSEQVEEQKPYEELKQERDTLADLIHEVFEEKENYRQEVEQLEDRITTLEQRVERYREGYSTFDDALENMLRYASDEIESAEEDLSEASITFDDVARYIDGNSETAEWQQTLSDEFENLEIPVFVIEENHQYTLKLPYGSQSGPLSTYLGKIFYNTVTEENGEDAIEKTITDYSLEATLPKHTFSQPPTTPLLTTFTAGPVPVDVNMHPIQNVESTEPVETTDSESFVEWEIEDELVTRWERTSGIGSTTINAVEQFFESFDPYEEPVSTVLENHHTEIVEETKGVGETKFQRLLEATKEYEEHDNR